jgi:uncharacterized protein
MIRWILTALALLLLLRLVLRFVLGLLQGLLVTEPAGARRGGAGVSGGGRGGPGRVAAALVRDPVCGTFIPRDTAVTASIAGETRYYCSDACRAKDGAATGRPPIGRTAHG